MEKVGLLVPILPFVLHNYLFLEFSPCYKIWKDITKSFVELQKQEIRVQEYIPLHHFGCMHTCSGSGRHVIPPCSESLFVMGPLVLLISLSGE